MDKQKGFTLVELAIVVAISAFLIGSKLIEKANELRFSRAEAQVGILKVLSDGYRGYAAQHKTAIFNSTPIPVPECLDCVPAVAAGNVAVNLAPTFGELQALGFLPKGINNRSLYGNNGYGASMIAQPVGCLPAACVSIETFVWMNNPVILNFEGGDGGIDGPSIGVFHEKGGSNVLSCSIETGAGVCSDLTSVNGTLSRPNPVVGTPVGIVGVLEVSVGDPSGGGGTFDDSALYRLDGTRPLTGDLDAGGQDLSNVTSLTTSTATVTNDATARDFIVNGTSSRLSTAVAGMQIVKPGENVIKPTCAAPLSPRIYIAPAMYSNVDAGGPVQAVQTWATNASPTEWQTHMRILVQPSLDTNAVTTPANDGWVQDDDFTKGGVDYGLVSVSVKCG